MSNTRNDSILYTGINSLSNEPRTPRQLQKESKVLAHQKLKPAADLVLEFLEKEKNALYDMRTMYFDEKTTGDELRIERILRVRQEQLIVRLEARIKTIMALDKKESKNE